MLDCLKTSAPKDGAGGAPASEVASTAPSEAGVAAATPEAGAPAPPSAPGKDRKAALKNAGHSMAVVHATPAEPPRFAVAFTASAVAERNAADTQVALQPVPGAEAIKALTSASRYASPFWRQFAAVALRHWRETLRVRDFTAIRLFILLFLAFFYGIVWNGVAANQTSQTAVFSTLGVLVFTVSFASIITFTTSAPVYAIQRGVFYREKAGSYYRPEAYTAAMLVTEIPWLAASLLCFLVIMYPLVGLEWTATVFFSHYLAVLICMVYFMWVAQAFIYFLPTLQLAQILSVRPLVCPVLQTCKGGSDSARAATWCALSQQYTALFARTSPPGHDVFSSNSICWAVHSRGVHERLVSRSSF